MTYEEIVAATREEFLKKDASKLDGHLAVQIDIIGEGEGAFYIELKDHEIHVEPYEYYDHDVKLIASAKTFIKLSDGTMDSVAAYLTGKLKVEGDLGKAMEFQKIVDAEEK